MIKIVGAGANRLAVAEFRGTVAAPELANFSGVSQIWSMLADGTNQKQLTSAGSNTQPVWARIPVD